jgi:hypothetical protein
MSVDGHFDDATILAMCLAFDRTCGSLQTCGVAATVQEIVATRIVEAAIQGEQNPDRLHDEAVKAFDLEKIRRPIAA